MQKIKTAVVPVAGLGTRFLPITKSLPKEMLPIVDKPVVQYAVEEALAVGVEQIVFVTSATKRSIEDHFDDDICAHHPKLAKLSRVIPESVHCVYVRQKQQRGLGDAVLTAKSVVGNEPFWVLLPDDLIDEPSSGDTLKKMLSRQQAIGSCSVVAVQEMAVESLHQYGVVSCSGTDHQVDRIVEKPKQGTAPSNRAVVGRYLLQPSIFTYLQQCGPGAGGELQLTDAIASLMKHEPVVAVDLVGTRFDCGSKLGFLEANITFGLRHPTLGPELKDFLFHEVLPQE